MSRRTLQVAIEAGERTCYAEPGKPCPWVRVARFGMAWTCGLDPSAHHLREGSRDGKVGHGSWLLRSEWCLAAEVSP